MKCDFHSRFDNPSQLSNGWSDLPVESVHPPMPNYFDNNDGFNFHYCKPTQVIQAQFTEKYSLTKEKVPNLAQESDTDDYCPRVQLENLIESCGAPKLSFQQISNSDGSTTYLPVDANDTKTKIMAKIDNFVKEYTGEDLRNTILSDVNHYLSNSIEKEVKKRIRQDKKAECLSLKINDIDWEEMALSGKFDKLYVAQLDMYLSEVVGIGAKDIRAKGFNADKKVAFVRKYALRNCSNLDQSYADVTSNKSLRTVRAIVPSNNINQISNGTLNIIPWAGNFHREGQNVELVNTCPIDNYLMMFDYLYQDRKVEIDQLPAPLPNILQQIHELLVDKGFGEAKYKWVDNPPNPPVIANGKVDVFGNENQTVITGLFAVTYGSGAHFISAIKMSPPIMKQDGWFLYDGLMEKRQQGTGVQILPDDPKPPHTYRLSYLICLKD